MTFHVDPKALLAYGRQLVRAGEAAGHIKDYLDKYNPGIDSSGVMARLGGAHISVLMRVGEIFPRIGKVLDASDAELRKAAGYYDKTDRAAARRMDVDLPGVQ